MSLTALVGGDARVREAHRESVDRALTELETYVEARMGGNAAAVSTGAWVAAKFEHDSSRPVAGYVAPQLHTHVVFFNLTELENGETRPLQPRDYIEPSSTRRPFTGPNWLSGYGNWVMKRSAAQAARRRFAGIPSNISKPRAPVANRFRRTWLSKG